MEMAVKPGMVLISFAYSSPPARKKSTRASPAQSSAWKVRMASSCTAATCAGASCAGTTVVAPLSSRYFAAYE